MIKQGGKASKPRKVELRKYYHGVKESKIQQTKKVRVGKAKTMGLKYVKQRSNGRNEDGGGVWAEGRMKPELCQWGTSQGLAILAAQTSCSVYLEVIGPVRSCPSKGIELKDHIYIYTVGVYYGL